MRLFGLEHSLPKIGLVAALALCAFAASLWAAPGVPGVLGGCLALIALAIAAIDARLFIIPNELNGAALALALVNAAVTTQEGMLEAVCMAVLRGAVVLLLFYGLHVGYRRLRGRDGIGLGDVKLAGVAGAWLSWAAIPIAIEIAALGAIAVVLVRRYAAGQPLDAALKLPFGLFLGPSIWLGWFIETMVLAPASTL